MLIVAMLLTSGAAFAEEPQFTLRNGLTWGMSPEEVREIEGNDAYEGSIENRISILQYESGKVSKFYGVFTTFFANEKLFFCCYWLENDQNSEYLSQALTSKYGESQSVASTVIYNFRNNIDSGDYADDISDGQQWIVSDTTVWLFTYDGSILLFYYLTDFDWGEIGVYDTFGL